MRSTTAGLRKDGHAPIDATIEVDTMREPELLAHQDKGHLNSDASWSPDGKQIVFMSDR
jgi:Tol biopolymer transport system component